MNEEAECAQAYHETRCQQELQRINEARCERSRRAHICLFHLHYSMSVNPGGDLTTAALAMAV